MLVEILLGTLAALLIPWPGSPEPPTPRVKTIAYSEFLYSLDKGHIAECEVGQRDITYSLKNNPTLYSTIQPTAPRHLIDKMAEKGVAFRQEDERERRYLRDGGGGGGVDVAGAVLNAVLYGATGFGLWWLGKQAEENQGKGDVGLKADETSFDKSISFDDIGGIDESKALVMEVVDIMKHPERYSRVGARIPKGILLCGPPGTGKTLLARCIASEASLPFFFCSGSDFVEMFVGRGAARVRDLFERARSAAPSVLFIDEIDALGKQRGRGGFGSGNDEGEHTLNQLLACMDGIDTKTGPGVLCIAATNRIDILDEALVRPGRFDRVIKVGLPDAKGRKAVLKVHTRSLPLDQDVDFDAIARSTEAMSPAEIAAIANEAAIGAARRGGERVSQADFLQALSRHISSRSTTLEDDGRGQQGREHQKEVWDEMFLRFLLHHQQQFGAGGGTGAGEDSGGARWEEEGGVEVQGT